MSSSKEIYLLRDFAAGVFQSLKTGDTVMLIFSIQLCELWISTRIQCVRGRYGVLGPRQINTCHKVPLQDNYLDEWYHWIWLYKVIQSYMLEIL